MPQPDIDIPGLRKLQQKIIDCYNQQNGNGVDVLLEELKNHPANNREQWFVNQLSYFLKNVSSAQGQADLSAMQADARAATKSGGIDRDGLRTLQQKIIDCYNKEHGENVESLLRAFRAHPANYANKWVATNLAYIAKQIKHTPTKLEIFEQVLSLDPDNVFHLTSYANALIRARKLEQALSILDKITQDNPRDFKALTTYGNALVQEGDHAKAREVFAAALAVKPNDTTTLTSYANALAAHGDYEHAFERFEQSLALEPKDTTTLTSYANALAAHGDYEHAFERFEQSLALEENTTTLTSYANALAEHGDYEEAFVRFEQSLEIEPNDTTTLNSYGKALAAHGDYEHAFERFEQSLAIEKENTTTLNSYANALIQADRLTEAFKYLEQSQQLAPENPILLATYATALAAYGETQAALDKFAQARTLDPRNILTLTNYGKALAQAEQYTEALALFEEVSQLVPDDTIALFLAAQTLQMLKKPAEALAKLKHIQLDKVSLRDAEFFRLNMGRLYFQLGKEAEGRRMFEHIIQHARNTDTARLRIAMNLLITKPYSEEANKLLEEIADSSPGYQQARRMLALNLDSKRHYEMFAQDGDIEDRAQINRTLYHKIKNRIAVLKETLHETLLDNDDPVLRELLSKIDGIISGIKQRRAQENAQTGQLDKTDYSALLNIISATANDIIDFVGNKISNLREELWDTVFDLPQDDPRQALYQEVSQQLQRTVAALNDLKAVNAGIQLKLSATTLQDLFANWLNTLSLRNATISVELSNPQQSLTTDVQKIRGFLDELLENSLKHNAQQQDLHIRLHGDIQTGLPLRLNGSSVNIPGQNKYLYLCVRDNGKGIPADKKDWIFRPLTTTSTNDEGSGLGLFGIRRTLAELHGFIEETGSDGARFDIYIPLEVV